ncbi:alpha/beta fold hydrolase [Phenylobacterium sp.]|uniref:alpha/beta fold hydrolase n=1 Tax=Phenylobacterium sp. TaxID=1871053 RepID=UPI0028A1728F|nr:alpha/beta fold hydrolase [Phenylobacterium sp.]
MRPVSETKWINCVIPSGDTLIFAARPELRDRHKSVVVLIHDVLSTPGSMAPWFGHLEPEAEVMLACLPGHGTAPLLSASGWDELVTGLHQSLRGVTQGRRVLVAGLGLGGLLALALNARGYASIAFDPFFATAGRWPLEVALERTEKRGQLPNPDFLFQALGWRDGALEQNRSYGALLDRLKAPALVVCGDVPLSPPRDLALAPSLMDEADHALAAAYPDLRVQIAAGCGHDVLSQATSLCREIILDELARA